MSGRSLLSAAGRRRLGLVAALALVIWAVGTAFAPGVGWASYLTAMFYFLSLALGGAVFLALHSVANAGWHVAIKRPAEAMAAYVPVGAVGMLLVLVGVRDLYHWADPHAAHDPLLQAKHAFLNVPAFAARMAIVLAIWSLLVWRLRRNSVLQDADGSLAHTRANVALSAIFLLVFAWTFSLASVDWLMSLEPHWFSTIFGFYNLSGVLLGGVATLAVLVILLRNMDLLPEAAPGHLHDLGKLTFGFSTFWAYLWISQYLLVWYSNIPEETAYFVARAHGGWSLLFWLNLALNWIVPFFLLMPRAGKRHEVNLLWACGFTLAGRWLDVYLMVAPSAQPSHIGIGLTDVAATVGVGALFLLAVDRALGGAPLVARRDPYLVESLHHHV
ncbi:MAG: hypothetical protein AABZ30_13525 [Myxococcota bacterium]